MSRWTCARIPVLRKIRNKHVRRFCAVGLVVLLVCTLWFTVNRVVAPLSAVRVVTMRTPLSNAPKYEGRLCIATYNIAHGRGTADTNWQVGRKASQLQRLDAIARLIEDRGADIVVLNEVDFGSFWSSNVNQALYIAEKAGFPYLVEQRNYDTAVPFASLCWGNAVLSRHPVGNVSVVDFPAYSRWERVLAGHKKGLLCDIHLNGQISIRLLGVHLEHRSERTRVQAAEMIGEIVKASPIPLLAAGDFNSSPVGFPKTHPTAEGKTALTSLLSTEAFRTTPLANPQPDDYTFPSTNPDRVIDWILIPADWRMLKKTVVSQDTSDHAAVFMQVKVLPTKRGK